MQRQLEQLADEHRGAAVGVGVAIAQGDEVFEATSGLAHAEQDRAMTPDTVTQVGSTTKVFNGALAMTLVDEGVVDLDVPVRKYIPDLVLSDSLATDTVTLRHLLSMSSGMDNGPYLDLGGSYEERIGRYVAAIREVPHVFTPGSGYSYSNASTVLSGHALECATGKSWDELLRERIIEPCGLAFTSTLPEQLLLQRISAGHRVGGEIIRPWYMTQSMGPAGSTLASTAGDLVRFMRVLMLDGMGAGGRVLSTAAIETMTTPQIEIPTRSYARSWCVGPACLDWNGVRVFGHTGGNQSGASRMYWAPALKTAVAVVTNTPSKTKIDPLLNAALELVGLTREFVSMPDTDSLVADTHRYVGAYEAAGQRFVIEAGEEGRLSLALTAGGRTFNSGLVSLGGDRFAYEASRGKDAVDDVAFFGNDDQGRATHYLSNIFAARRVPDAASG